MSTLGQGPVWASEDDANDLTPYRSPDADARLQPRLNPVPPEHTELFCCPLSFPGAILLYALPLL